MEYKQTSKVVHVRFEDFMVHIDASQHLIQFKVYPISEWEDLSTSEEGISYINKETEEDWYNEFEEGKCLKKLEGSFCWRGVWEGRLYFPDYEYWGEEIEVLSKLYNYHIVPWCKEFIKKRDHIIIGINEAKYFKGSLELKQNECLEWIYQRLINVYNENPNVDYMRKFADIINPKE